MWRGGLLVLAALLLVRGPAWAQTAVERPAPPQAVQGWTPSAPQTAEQQQAADPWQLYPPTPGITVGQSTLYPSVTGGAFYDDNVFATHSNRQGSWGGFVRPEIGVNTVGQNYSVQTHAFVEDQWDARFSSEDQLNGAAAIASTVMPDPDTQIVAKAGFLRAHEARGTGESELNQFDKPVGYDNFQASGALNKRFDRWWTSLGVAGSWLNYDTPTVGGVPVSQSYRDGNIGVVSGRVGYVVAPLTSLFVEVSGNRRHFDVNIYDSDGYRVVGGVLLEQGPGARVKGEAYAGYMNQDYQGATFNTVSTYTYGGQLAWLLAPRWTATTYGSRNALESSLNGGVSLIESVAAGRLDYQVKPNFIVGAGVGYISDEFLGAGRTDHSWNPLVSIKYLATPNVTLGFDYTTISFASNGVGVSSYYRDVYLFSLNARL